MNTESTGRIITQAVLLMAVWGCVVSQPSEPPRKAVYADPTEIVAGTAGKATMYDLESAAVELMEQMRSSPRFSEEYSAVINALQHASPPKRRPMIVVAFLENRTTQRVQGRLDAVRDTIAASLFNSGIFDVKDDEATAKILGRIVRGVDGGMEKGTLLQTIGERDALDFMLTGELRHFEDFGGVHTYRLSLAIHSLKTGRTIWQGIQTKVKL
jgi:hypothetical protein